MSYFKDPYVPATQRILAKYRGPSNSREFNTFITDVYGDITSLAEQINRYNTELTVWNKVMLQNGRWSQEKLSDISTTLSQLESLFGTLGDKTNRRAYVGYTSNENISFGGWDGYPVLTPSMRVHQDLIYGQAVPRFAAAPVSKMYIYDALEGDVVLSEDAVTLAPTSTTDGYTGSILEEADADYVINGDDSVHYYRVVEYTEEPALGYEELTVTIKIPRDIVNTLQANYVTIHPFPEYSLTLHRLELTGLNGEINKIVGPDYVDDSTILEPIASLGKQRFIFLPRDVDTVVVVLRNPNPDLQVVPGKYTYIFGVSNIGIGSLSLGSSSKMLTKFKLYNNRFRRVNTIGPSIDGVSYSPWYEGTDLDLHQTSLGMSMPIDTNTIWVESTFTVTDLVLPVATYLYIDYTPWDVS